MPEASAIVYECPGCGKAVEPGEDYVAAREYLPPSDFSLHMKGHEEAARMLGISRETVRRFVQNGTLEGVLLYEGAPMVSAGTVTISA